MKKIFIYSLLMVIAVFARATVTIDFQVGVLMGADGITPMADGKLIQVIAAPTTGAFVAPTTTSFISGSEILLFSGAFDSSTLGAGPGLMDIAIAPISISTLPAGWALMVQWFPTLNSTAIAPGASTPFGQYFGQFSPDATTITNVGSDIAWTSPPDSSLVTYNFLTLSSAVGGIANSTAAATQSTAPIPEPSTYAAIFGAMALGLAAYRRRARAV
jgi:hypothetical protein